VRIALAYTATSAGGSSGARRTLLPATPPAGIVWGVMAEPARARKTAGEDPRGSNRVEEVREAVAHIFTRIEDLVYVGLGVLLAGSALVLLGSGIIDFVGYVAAGSLTGSVIELLDRILLILMIVEILYTVQVSFREHVLAPEPFLIVGLIAGIRRVLVITAEFSKLLERGEVAFRNAMIELGLLTVMIVALVASLLMLRRRGTPAVADRG
jgi:Phosphate-starvation-inducible E family